MRRWRSNRLIFFFVCIFACAALITISAAGVLAPVEGLASTPLNFFSGILNQVALVVSNGVGDLAELQTLRERNADLEEALAQFQAELVELREIASDYRRLAELLDYTTTTENQEFVAADVILQADANNFLQTIVINRGARDGLTIGMPVVTRQGLVGRVLQISANASRVLLITDPSSAVSGRLQTTRAEGSVIGLTTDLRMTFIPLDSQIQQGDLVITSGLGGNFPPNIVIGVVTSIRQFEFDGFQQAEIQSLNNFDTLEIVLVITNFQPIDLSVFEEENQEGAQ